MKKRLALLAMIGGLVVAAAGASPVQADPFYCDGVGPAISSSDNINCGSTGVCYWEYLGNGLWLEKCLPYCDIHYCG